MTVFIKPISNNGGSQFLRIKGVRKISFSNGEVILHRLMKTESFSVGTSPKVESFKNQKAVYITAGIKPKRRKSS